MADETTEQLRKQVKKLEGELEEIKEEKGDADKYASIGSRVAATVIDIFLIFVLLIAIGFVLTIIEAVVSLAALMSWLLVLVLFLVLPFAYFIFLEGGIGKGQTIGKRLLHIKVINETGGTPSYTQSFLRTLTRFADLQIIYHIIGLIVASLTEKRQRVGDLLAKTLVVKEDVTTPPKSKAEKKSTTVVILLALFVLFTLVMMVLIVGIVLWQLGIFNLDGTSKTSIGFGAVKPLSWAVNDDGSAVITMTSGEGAKITLTGCSMSMQGSDCGNCIIGNTEISPGREFQITVEPGSICEGYPGDSYSADVSISYDKRIGTVTESHESTGTIRGPYE